MEVESINRRINYSVITGSINNENLNGLIELLVYAERVLRRDLKIFKCSIVK